MSHFKARGFRGAQPVRTTKRFTASSSTPSAAAQGGRGEHEPGQTKRGLRCCGPSWSLGVSYFPRSRKQTLALSSLIPRSALLTAEQRICRDPRRPLEAQIHQAPTSFGPVRVVPVRLYRARPRHSPRSPVRGSDGVHWGGRRRRRRCRCCCCCDYGSKGRWNPSVSLTARRNTAAQRSSQCRGPVCPPGSAGLWRFSSAFPARALRPPLPPRSVALRQEEPFTHRIKRAGAGPHGGSPPITAVLPAQRD
ncbi:hypothetical protein AOLI_G00027510 [Acnodon oligacanthus]